jgi:hypothetical protein
LGVGVDGNELHAEDLLFDHAVHGVAAATARADHFDGWEDVKVGLGEGSHGGEGAPFFSGGLPVSSQYSQLVLLTDACHRTAPALV